MSPGELKGTPPPNPASHSDLDGSESGQSVSEEGVEGAGHTKLSCKRAVKDGRKQRMTQEEAESESFSISLNRNSIKSTLQN